MNRMLIEDERLARQIDFLVEIDRLKHVIRRAYLPGSDRRENSAEHSWHLAMAAPALVEYADEPVDLSRVLRLVLVHDIVEIDADDTFFYDPVGMVDKAEREERAADRIFGLLPADQAADIRALWNEFEARDTAEARFAHALDRFMPLLHNYLTQGRTWRQNAVGSEQVMAMIANIAPGSTGLAAYARALVADAMDKGYFDPTRNTTYGA